MSKISNALIFVAFAIQLLFASCNKNTNSLTISPASQIAGVWDMRGTHQYLAIRTTDFINTNIAIWKVDDTTILMYSSDAISSGYSVHYLHQDSNSIYVFDNYSYTVKENTLQLYSFIPESGNYQIISLQSDSHTPLANSAVTSGTSRMVGTKQWHGTFQTVYDPPWYTGLPPFDTTFSEPLTMNIYALSDTMILAYLMYYDGGTGYLVLKKTHDDPSTTVFSTPDYSYRTITYYSVNKSMFYFDSSAGSVAKYYTP